MLRKLGAFVSVLVISLNAFSEPFTPPVKDHAVTGNGTNASAGADAGAPAKPKPAPLPLPPPPPKPAFKMVESMGEKDFVEKLNNPCAGFTKPEDGVVESNQDKTIRRICSLFESSSGSAEKSPPLGEYFGVCFVRKVKKQTLEKLEVTPDILAGPADWEEEKPVQMEVSIDFIPQEVKSDGELTTTEAIMMKDHGEITKERKLAFDPGKSWVHHEERNLASGPVWHSLINDHSEVRHGKTKSGKEFVARISTNYHKSYKPLPDGHWGQIGVNASTEICLFNHK